MKRKLPLVTVLLLFFVHYGYTQNNSVQEMQNFPRHEVNYNILNTIIMASAEVGYEYFIEYNQSVGVKFLINDRQNYHSEDEGEFKTNSVRLNYTYYFGELKPGSEFYVQPFMKYRFGDYTETVDNTTLTTNMNSFMIGIGVGYVWNFSNNFVIGPFANIARNFSEEVKTRFTALDWNAGVNIGYRF